MVKLNHSPYRDIDFEHIFEMSPDLVFILDRDYTILRANKAFASRMNISPDSLIGSKCYWCLYQIDEPPDSCPHFLMLKDGKEHKSELFIESLDGWFSITATPLLNNEDAIWGSIYTARDITVQKRLESALRDSEEKYSKAFQTSFYAIAITSLEEGTYFDINDAFSTITGFTREEIINNSSIDLNLWVDEKDRKRIISALIKGNEVKGNELQIRRKNGAVISTLFSAEIISIRNNLFLLSSILDISDRKQAEEEVKLKNNELAKLNSEKDKFFSIIAHDLRNPFNSLLGFTQVLVDDLSNLTAGEIKMIALTMRKSASTLYGLLENLLEWSRMQRGMIPFEPAPVLLLPSISSDLQSAMELAIRKEITIHNTIEDHLMVFADKYMLGGIIRNLSFNAVKFTPKKGKVTISAKPIPDGLVEISIKDTGIGMNKAMIENLFRLDVNICRNGTDGEPSTGLGLILSKEFVEKNGGRLWAESEEGLGTTFYFTVPKAGETQPIATSEDIPSHLKEHKQAKTLKTLLVEDDEASKMLLSISLAREGFTVLEAGTGVEAVEICRNTAGIDLVLMDINLPEMDGLEATRQIRQFNKEIIIIAQTAYKQLFEKVNAIEAGCNDFIVKPIDSKLLRGLIRKYYPL